MPTRSCPKATSRPDSVAALTSGFQFAPLRPEKIVAGMSFFEIFNRSGLENQIPIIVWVLLVQVIGLAAAPLAFKALGSLPDKGYGLARSLGILLLAWLTWISASIGLLPNSRATVATMFLLEILIGAVLFLRQRQQIRAFWQAKRGLVMTTELVFWCAFALFLLIRMANPDLWHPYRGGEKPMDLAYLMAVIRSAQFPPYDPWFAGGYINYYYFGQVIVGTLIKLSGIVPTSAYNLAVPLLFALTASGVFSVAYALVANSRENRRGIGAPLTGLFAMAFAVLLGNLGGAVQVIDQLARLGGGRSGQLGLSYLSWFARGLLLVVTRAQPLDIPSDWYWASTRVIPGTINEFPFFTFLYADLHAHMIALPFTILALAFAVSFIRMNWSFPHSFRRRGNDWSVVAIFLASLTLGSLYVTNSWDFPTYALILSVTMVFPWYMGQLSDVRRLAEGIIMAVAMVALAVILYLPFHRSFQSFYFGVDPFPEKSELAQYLVIHGLFFFALLSYVILDLAQRYGDAGTVRTLLLALTSPGRVERMVRLHKRLVKRTSSNWIGTASLIVVIVGILAFVAWMKLLLVAVLAGALLLVLLLMAKRDRPPEEMFVLGVTALGFGLSIAVEFFALKGDVGRMNTVFKFYLQIWMLWAIASAFAIQKVRRKLATWESVSRGRAGADPVSSIPTSPVSFEESPQPLAEGVQGPTACLEGTVLDSGETLGAIHCAPTGITAPGVGARFIAPAVPIRKGRLTTAGRIWLVALAFVVGAAAVYPLLATRAKVSDRFDPRIPLTLDGTAYMRHSIYNDEKGQIPLASDLAAITWLQDHIAGAPVILEAQTPFYRWGSRISIYTGLPTVLGWDWHQKQQRWGYQWVVDKRVADIATMYTSPSVETRLALLREYGVSYIYVGDLERAYYSAPAVARFDSMVGDSLEVVYDGMGVKIYRVKG